MTKKKAQNLYQFKITLNHAKPSIWRRIQVPETFSFLDLHDAIQAAMGWEDCHLHCFEVPNPKTSQIDFIGSEMADLDLEFSPGSKNCISSYFSLLNTKATYEYDFGDGWEHKILLEKILPIEPGVKYPRCIAGKRACPPEDCGGVWGYENLLKMMNIPDNEVDEEQKEYLEYMIDDDFDPQVVKFY